MIPSKADILRQLQRDILPLQAADLLAGQVRLALLEGSPPPALRDMFRERQIKIHKWTEQDLVNYVSAMRIGSDVFSNVKTD